MAQTATLPMPEKGQFENEAGLIFQHVARQRVKALDALLAPHGLTSAQVYLLNWLLREDGRTQIELARLLNIGTVAVSGMVDRLEAAEWVERRADQSDRRTKRVFLKPSAMSKKHVLSEAAASVNASSFDGMTDGEVDLLLSLMRRVRGNLNKALEGQKPSLAEAPNDKTSD
ncbi:MAG: MarR family transcriptional regulator [Pseudomonadota bacterium]